MPVNQSLATAIALDVGGPENVSYVQTCATRLRFTVRDESKVDFDHLDSLSGVVKALKAGGQVQVVIGADVEDVKRDLMGLPGWNTIGGSVPVAPTTKRSPLDVVFDFLGATFQPLIPPITGAALVQVVALLLAQFGVLSPESPTYTILFAAGNAVFYFLPILVAFTASQKLGANPFVGASIGAALVFPGLVAIGETGDVLQAFGLPLFVYGYGNTMFPSLIVAVALAAMDRLLRRYIPKMLQQVLNPTLEILILVPLTVLLFGPIGAVFGNAIAAAVGWLATSAPFIFYLVVPALWIFLVAMGIHWAMIAVALQELAVGPSAMMGAAFGYQYAMVGIAVAVFVKTTIDRRNPELRSTAAAASLSVLIGGITEPTLYGLVLRYRRLLAIELIAATASGAVLGIFATRLIAFSPAPILALPLMSPVIGGVLGLLTAVVVALVLIMIWGVEGKDKEPVADRATRSRSSDTPSEASARVIPSPLSGKVVPLNEVGDPVFAGGMLGSGVAIEPDEGHVISPVDGVVTSVAKTGHAVVVKADSGLEVLIHVGLDTVKLQGTHLQPQVEQGQSVSVGQPLLDFDIDGIRADGFSVTTPVVLLNVRPEEEAVPATGWVTAGSELIVLGDRARPVAEASSGPDQAGI